MKISKKRTKDAFKLICNATPTHTHDPKPKLTCKLCKKGRPKHLLFCEQCLSKPNRDKTFQKRLRIVIDMAHYKSREYSK